MKVLIASQPKTGNVWIRNLLAQAYGLSDLNEKFGDTVPETVSDFIPWVSVHGFPNNSILHQHFFPKNELLQYAKKERIRLVTMVRNPYEAFVSFFFYVNRSPHIFRGRSPGILVGKSIDDPDVMHFLATNYRMHLNMSVQWIESGASSIVRYEDLLADPQEELSHLLENWQTRLSQQVITDAVDYCSAERMRKKGGWKAVHIRTAKAKTWDRYLTEGHLQVFQKHHGDLIQRMGYDIV